VCCRKNWPSTEKQWADNATFKDDYAAKIILGITKARGTTRLNTPLLRLIIRVFVSLLLLGVVFFAVDLKSALQLLKATDYLYLSFGLLFFCINRVLMAYRWNALSRVKGIDLSLLQSLKIYLLSNFFGSFLPSGVGGDVYRIYHAAKQAGHTGEVAASVIMERFIGMLTRSTVALFGVMLLLATYHETSFGSNLYKIILAFCLFTGLAFWISIHDGTVRILMRLGDWFGDHWILRICLKFQRAYVDYKKNVGTLLFVFILSLIGVGLVSVGNYYAARALNINVGVMFYFGIISIVNIVSRIPVSVAGLGLTEGTYVLLFSIVGVSTTEAFALAVLVRITESLFAFSGGVLYVLGVRAEPRTPDAPIMNLGRVE